MRYLDIETRNKNTAMKRGKYVCETLKTVRKQIADANDIKYEPRECTHEGDCLGTCPACEAEVKYIERELDIRRKLGKAVAVVGVSAGLAGLSGCGVVKTIVDPPLAGIPVMPDRPEVVEPRELMGKPAIPDSVQKARADSLQAACDDEKLFGVISDNFPMFEGGDLALMEYIKSNIRYPEGNEPVNGRVIVTFTVEKDGTVSNPTVARSLDNGGYYDQEALRVVSSMPKWTPGTRNGQQAAHKYTLPVIFKR